MDKLQILERGLKRIQQGWTKGTTRRRFDNGTTKRTLFCAVGALEPAAPYSSNRYHVLAQQEQAARFAARALLDQLLGGCWVWTWNDEPARTKSEVVDLFRKAIAAAKAETTTSHSSASSV